LQALFRAEKARRHRLGQRSAMVRFPALPDLAGRLVDFVMTLSNCADKLNRSRI
jgi:hypothetical protein